MVYTYTYVYEYYGTFVFTEFKAQHVFYVESIILHSYVCIKTLIFNVETK